MDPLIIPLDPNEYVASPANINRLLKNVSAQRAYAEGLEAESACYKAQVEAVREWAGGVE